jgi:glycosyltransferase involved in cell wall biosynthesis
MQENEAMPASQTLVSIVVPSFNQGRFLEETLRSVLEQTYPLVECIVIDGGSKDESVFVIKKYEGRLKYWHSRPDKGHTDALIQGFGHSAGEILAWVNSDDLLAPDAVEKAAAALERKPDAVMVYGNRVCIDERSRLLYFRPSMPLLARTPYISFTVPQESCFWRREAYFKVGGVRTELWFSFDYELFSRFALMGEVFYDSGIWGFFRKHSASKTMTAYQTVGLKDNFMVQELLWGGRVNPVKWSAARMFFRLYSICAMMWVPRPAWPACLPVGSRQSLPRRIYGSLHEGSMTKRVLKRFFKEVEG